MDRELELQKEMFSMWLKKLYQKSSMIKTLAGSLGSQHGMQYSSKMLDNFVKDCEKLFDLGYEIGYVQYMPTSDEKVQTCGYFIN